MITSCGSVFLINALAWTVQSLTCLGTSPSFVNSDVTFSFDSSSDLSMCSRIWFDSGEILQFEAGKTRQELYLFCYFSLHY